MTERSTVPWQNHNRSSDTLPTLWAETLSRFREYATTPETGEQYNLDDKSRITPGGGDDKCWEQWYFRNSQPGHNEGGQVRFLWDGVAHYRLMFLLLSGHWGQIKSAHTQAKQAYQEIMLGDNLNDLSWQI